MIFDDRTEDERDIATVSAILKKEKSGLVFWVDSELVPLEHGDHNDDVASSGLRSNMTPIEIIAHLSACISILAGGLANKKPGGQ